MTTNEIFLLARNLMEKHGIGYWRITWSNAKRKSASCNERREAIILSKVILPRFTDKAVFNTITHEIAHALVGAHHHHDRVWQSKHIELGGDGKRCYSYESFVEGEAEKVKSMRVTAFRYKGVCPNGHEHFRKRIGAPTSCGHCSRRFDLKYLIKWEVIK